MGLRVFGSAPRLASARFPCGRPPGTNRKTMTRGERTAIRESSPLTWMGNYVTILLDTCDTTAQLPPLSPFMLRRA